MEDSTRTKAKTEVLLRRKHNWISTTSCAWVLIWPQLPSATDSEKPKALVGNQSRRGFQVFPYPSTWGLYQPFRSSATFGSQVSFPTLRLHADLSPSIHRTVGHKNTMMVDLRILKICKQIKRVQQQASFQIINPHGWSWGPPYKS